MDVLAVGVAWLALALLFLRLQDAWSWGVLFPLIGFLWLAVPLLVTRLAARPLFIASVTSLLLATVGFLLAVWTAVIILGGIGSVVFELEGRSGSEIAFRLAIAGLMVVPGAALGAGAGLAWRWRRMRPQANNRV